MIETKIAGGSFVLDDIDSELVVTPEDFNEEQRMILQTTVDFLEGEVLPKDEEIEKLDYELTLDLLKKAGELGLLSADVPEEYDGLGLDKVSSTIISETLARAASFGLSVGAHVGIGTLPIVFFGTPEQKKKYLPQLATGEKIAAYCLTEPASGSDALGAKTTAKLSEDGQHYILNGSKIFITNAGFADIFIVYAKVDGKDFSAFIVEKEMPGFSLGPEEKKMGIKGSSTRPLYFEDCKVPVENLLGEVGRGHIIAFNILNIGRFKLGAGCLGGAKEAIEHSVKYANTRKQFGTEISSFPLIGKKLADMNIRTFVAESMVYRTSGLIDHILKDLDHSSPDAGKQSAKGIAEYALECSINKVFASEVLDFVADEAVQIHGGYGFTQEYKVERIYRDSRINRIFEGTNEINRMLIPGTLLKKAMKGELPLLQKVQSLQSEMMSMTPGSQSFEGTLEQESHLLAQAKKLFLMVGGMAVQKLQANIEKEQEMLSNLADLMIEIYAMESVLLRTKKLIARQGEDKAKNAIQMTEVYLHEAFAKIEAIAKQCLVMVEEGDMLRTGLSMVKRLTRTSPINTISLKREIAQRVIQAEKYVV
ncbi:acyl-CoA dehydrogenase family protein [Paenibacillus larvae]|uniref:Acyl-CoA dehydrogenase n=3 Tax=Paenibacillus larvae TaxID=1464 RepID=A0A1V0UNV8_9BACL|nr:acyl-CoA dehydrogenase family protein [Paenibacillus larvae]AQR77125.1 acyl-CoA dehydrogenase [Paenibacillus larvae subsp. larvae]ARF66776.1 acyl-CoA dehydrogenase [Paenibacillus larvae subsp. pulvifaciens]AVF21922.1 putative acyl-CoA dehydrogenase FadE [Paenibacillus larvae subsp. larvae]ETK27299.1 putative acyl-CoA dehydrogenase FadE [Paenibacillus larvae subsp. larvae DSM 25719]MCY7476341.1 acyl-CoA dehydrogenase family protein [Paenibacillus larvae]